MTEIEKLAAGRDYFKASYERKLNEHAETLRDYQQERDELRAKLAQATAQNARYRAALESIRRETEPLGEDYGHGTACGIARAILAEPPAASLEAVRAEAIREWCAAIQRARTGHASVLLMRAGEIEAEGRV